MKKFRLAVLAAVVCTAALLTSCIKEESYEVEMAYLDVSFTTRAGEPQAQGDKIDDVMVWAFQCVLNSDGTIKTEPQAGATAAGWRTVTGLNTYQSVNIHVELPMCGDGGQDYVLVAIVNKGQFGTINKTLNGSTTWADLKSAVFDASRTEYWAKHIGSAKGEDPDAMPVSHWTTFSVNKKNTHTLTDSQYKCAKVTMPVYRAVAKASLSMMKASNFKLTVTDAKLVSTDMPTNGVVLSSLQPAKLNAEQPTPTWFDPASPTYKKNAPARYLRATGDAEITGTNTVSVEGTATYDFVGSAVIYENAEACTQTETTYAEGTVSGKGYYLSVSYKIGEDSDGKEAPTFTKHVAIPYAVVRNHDYQINATVQADGQINVSYKVADWVDKTWNLAFDAPINTNIMPAPQNNAAPTAAPTMRYTNGTEEGAFVGYFKMTGPEGLTWQPTLTKGVRFSLAVYKVNENDNGTFTLAAEQSLPPIAADANQWYAIKVIALEPMDITNTANNEVSLGITYAPKWDEGATDFLFINQGASVNTSFWPDTYDDESSTFLLKITQNDQIN